MVVAHPASSAHYKFVKLPELEMSSNGISALQQHYCFTNEILIYSAHDEPMLIK